VNGPAAVEMAWSQAPGGESCIDRRSLVARVEETVGRSTFVKQGQGDTVIHGTIGPGPRGGWLAVVEARSAEAIAFRRELAYGASDCRGLDEAIVLVVALMVDSAEHAAPLAIPAAAQPPAVAIGPDVALAFGMLPGVAAGIGLVSEVTVPPVWPVALWIHAWPMSQALQDGSGGRLAAWTAGAGLCPLQLVRKTWALYGCAGATGGAIYSIGVGLDLARSNTRGYGQAEVQAGLRVRLGGPVFAGVEVGGAVPFARDSYSYVQSDGAVRDVFETAPVIPLGHARVEVRVP
jgi:hypothetical protein